VFDSLVLQLNSVYSYFCNVCNLLCYIIELCIVLEVLGYDHYGGVF